ncbi:magnesium and cobalt transport protein CorA [Nakamurella antarctica]|uniref:Magnesium and cobalt transport protein CorA n=1 Tax=Nakamurella antarctica TaxID=1902245 RepID=A0A3G8ZZQ8_9ACTN|nr:magnesium and cobalt transport protein CorA [Nakamurella antarctica]
MPSIPSLSALRRGSRSTGELAPVPSPANNSVIVDCATYFDGVRQSSCERPDDAIARVRAHGSGFVWIGLKEPEMADMAEVATSFGLHELAVEDAINAYQRAKIEQYSSSLFVVIKTVKYVEHESALKAVEIVNSGEIMMFLGADFIVTVRHGDHSGLAGLRQDLERDPARLALGPAAVMHAIADRIVDQYLAVVESVEDDIDEMESLVFDPTAILRTEQIYLLKREVLELRRAIAPLSAPMRRLAEMPNVFVPPEIRTYMRDVEDHLQQVSERVMAFDEILTTLVNAVLAQVATRQNEDMRKISAWAAIALVPTAVAGIYGMNFDFMPELHWTFGYPLALVLIAGICVLLYRTLRKRGWL